MKEKTIILRIYGDDYAANTFESEFGIDKTKEALKNDNLSEALDEFEDDFQYEVHEFGVIDPEFIKFVKNRIMDYDDSKHENFYVID